MLNKVVLIGRMTRNPESEFTPSGIAIAKFNIAVDRITKDAEGNKETDFIPIVAWRKTAEFVTEYLGKGRLVAVTGRLQIRKWTAQDGSQRYMTEVIADGVNALDRPKEGAAPAQAAPAGHPEDLDEGDAFANE